MAKKKSAKKASPNSKATSAKKAGKGLVRKASRLAPVKKAKSSPRKKKLSLGRPKVTAEEKLYMLFKDDYQARQLFEFLRVESVGELEQLSPEEIVRRLSAPVRHTVERIRAILADKNRSLRDDQEFAAKWQEKSEPAAGGGV